MVNPEGLILNKRKLLSHLYTLNNINKSEKRWLIKSLKKNKKSRALINQIISLVKEGGLDYAIEIMNKYHKLSLNDLETLKIVLIKTH